MLVDANLLLFAADRSSPHHEPAAAWLSDRLNGARRVGLPWATLAAFVRVATHPRVYAAPLDAATAWAQVEDWLAADAAWIPAPGPAHAAVLGALVREHHVTGDLVPDAHLAAIAIEHGLTICSADTDFARFTEARWINPLASA